MRQRTVRACLAAIVSAFVALGASGPTRAQDGNAEEGAEPHMAIHVLGAISLVQERAMCRLAWRP